MIVIPCKLTPIIITTNHTDNVPVGYGERVQKFERGVCLEWVNVGGLGDESVKLNFKYGFLQTESYILTETKNYILHGQINT